MDGAPNNNDRSEEDNPVVAKVIGCRKTGTRYNSGKGFIYTFHKETKIDNIFICKHQKPKNGGCNARLRQNKATGVYRKDGWPEHNHDPEKQEQQQLAIVNACVAAALVSRQAPRQIFDDVRATLPGIIGYGEALQRRIQRSKRERQPPTPKSAVQSADLLDGNPHLGYTLRDERPFYRGGVRTPDGGVALIFVSSTLAEPFSTATEIQADATFKSVPRLFKQMFTLHLSIDGKVYPFAYALMNNKSRELYDEVLDKIVDVFSSEFPDLTINIERSMTDYEAAIQGALKAAFMGCQCTGCWFHYKQAILRKARKFGLMPAFNRRPTITRIIKELFQLALLPANDIHNSFQDIKDHYREALRHEPEAHQVAIRKLFAYFYSYWIDEVGVATFSVYGLLDRTNNLVESWHRWFNLLCQRSHLNFWDFLECLRKAENQKARDYQCVVNGGATTRPRRQEQERVDAAITLNGNDFVSGVLTRREFLELSWKPNNREAQPAFHAALRMERRRYLAGTVHPSRNSRADRQQPIPAPASTDSEEENQPQESQLPETSSNNPSSSETDSEDEEEAHRQTQRRRRSPRVPQLPRHLSEFVVNH